MTRRLRTDRMLTQARHVRDTTALRDSVAEVARKLREGDLTISGARRALGLPPTGDPYGDTTAQQRPDDLAGALDWYGLAETDWPSPAFAEVTFPDAFTDEQIAEWHRVWNETVGNDPQPQRLVWLPSRPIGRIERPRKSAPRGPARMREHTISLLLGALRPDGSYVAAVRVSTCRAMRVLPWDIGYEHTSRITAGDGKPTGYAAVEDAYREHVIEPTLAHVSDKLGELLELPAGATGWIVANRPQGSQIEPDTNLPTPWVDPNGATEA